MKSPLVSFCFTTYKRPHYLGETLRGILLQTFTDFEIIISDNDPEASSRAVVAELGDPRIRYFVNAENLGMIRSYNKSLEHSSGEYIIMIADDDPVYPDLLQTLNHLRETYPGYGMYMGGCDWLCESSELAKLNNLRVGTTSCISSEHDLNHIQTFTTSEFIYTLFSMGIFSHYLWSCCMVQRDLLVRMGGVPDYGTPFLGDFAYLSIASQIKGCVVINKALGCQRMHKENFGRNQDEQLPVLAKKLPEYMEEKLSHIENWPAVKEKIMWFLALWLVEHMAFLYKYKRSNNIPYDGLLKAEKEIFVQPFIKKYQLKYSLKKNYPSLHNSIVRLKKSLTGKKK